MAILSNGKFYGFICSVKETGRKLANGVKEYVEDFVSGFSGHGWKLWEYVKGKWKLEIDTIVVRNTMVIFELLIQKIRAVKGALNITQASGKIKTAVYDETEQCWMITIEDEMSFVAHDFIRCQDWSNGVIKGYWVEIAEIRKVNDVDVLVIPLTEFSGSIGYINGMETVIADLPGMTTPVAGDEIIQFGNSVNVNRQSAIYIHADEGGQPAIDILFGIHSKSFAGCVKQRIGGDIPGTEGLKGFYCENGMIKGVNETGHAVYCIYPDGSAMLGDGSAQFNTDKSGHIAGGAISWQWDESKGKYVCTMGDVLLTWNNLSDDAKENLKGDKGDDAIVYELVPSSQIFVLSNTGIFRPEFVTCEVKKIQGNTYTMLTDASSLLAEGLRLAYSMDDGGDGAIDVEPMERVYPKAIMTYINFILLRNGDIIDKKEIRVCEDGQEGTPGEDANLLPWIEKWNGYATELGEEYIVTPKMFSGTKTTTPEGKVLLTGIAQGKECIMIDGVKRTGIFALVDNEIVFELDPINKKYVFKGRVDADEGTFKNVLIKDGSQIGNMKIIGNTLQGLQSIFGEYSSAASGPSGDYSIVNNIDSQQTYILTVRRNASFFLPDKDNLIAKGINADYSFKLSLIAQYQNGGTCDLVCNGDAKIIRNGVIISPLSMKKGETIDLFYHNNMYYISSASS